MTKVLFLIHDLGQGGAEKVLVNLVNNMDPQKFDVSVIAMFGGGVNEQFLKPEIKYHAVFPKLFPGNSHIMKLFSPKFLHKWFIKDEYDIEVSYLEGPTARVISGCRNGAKLVSWIHCTMKSAEDIALGFRSAKEAEKCYNKMDVMAFVSQACRNAFLAACPYHGRAEVCYNTNETKQILALAKEEAVFPKDTFCWCGVGKTVPIKGFDRMIRIQKRLVVAGHKTHLYILGEGPKRAELEQLAVNCSVADTVTFLGYQTNPYKYVAKCDLFVCASHSEGFSTAATEALILGTPVCTVDVSGMRELLGDNNEYGLVTDNSEDALYCGIKTLLDNYRLLEHYQEQAKFRGNKFETQNTVAAVEEMLLALVK